MTPHLQLVALRSVRSGPFDITLAAGECLAVTGPSGAGKSLMLRMVADLDPHEGDTLLDGRACSAIPAPAWRRQVVYSAAESGWWLDQVGSHFATPPVQAAKALGLNPAIFDQPVALCSTGERQRLALLRALEPDPLVLLLDEPTGALDESSTAKVEAMLQSRLAAGMVIIIVTHNPAQAARLATQHLRIERGKAVPA